MINFEDRIERLNICGTTSHFNGLERLVRDVAAERDEANRRLDALMRAFAIKEGRDGE